MLPIECIVRGYITGSAWKEYKAHGTMHGQHLPAGLQESDQLPEPVFTPSTKADDGGHDENISYDAGRRPRRGRDRGPGPGSCLELYRRGAEMAAERGIIIADTKFELGLVDGELVLCDEVLTPDSSPLLAGGRVGAGHRPRRASTSSPCATTWRASAGTSQPPPPTLPPRWSPPPGPATSRPTSASPAARFADWPGVA